MSFRETWLWAEQPERASLECERFLKTSYLTLFQRIFQRYQTSLKYKKHKKIDPSSFGSFFLPLVDLSVSVCLSVSLSDCLEGSCGATRDNSSRWAVTLVSFPRSSHMAGCGFPLDTDIFCKVTSERLILFKGVFKVILLENKRNPYFPHQASGSLDFGWCSVCVQRCTIRSIFRIWWTWGAMLDFKLSRKFLSSSLHWPALYPGRRGGHGGTFRFLTRLPSLQLSIH